MSKPKTCLDPLYHLIELDPIAVSIINTPPYQRLRHLNQTGLVEYVFPGATHNRFLHSLGVYHMAGVLLDILRQNQPELCISPEEIFLVKLAGLCHDLGHGPWSHTFDQYLEIRVPEEKHLATYRHEYRSCLILRQIVLDYKVPLTEFQLDSICYLIDPNLEVDSWLKNRSFLIDVISNAHDGLDVDKLDYLQRDPYYIGLTYKIDYTRLFRHAKVKDGRISYPYKIKSDIHDVFYYRLKLHREVYHHPVVRGIELLMFDIFDLMLDDILEILKFGDSNLEEQEARVLYERFLSLTDTLIHSMYYYQTSDSISALFNSNLSIPDHLKEAYLKQTEQKLKIKELIGRLSERKLFVFLGEIPYEKEEEFNQKIKDLKFEHDLVTYHSKIGYESNPVEKINFDYSKDLSLINTKSYSYGLNDIDSSYRIYSRKRLVLEEEQEIKKKIKELS